MSNNQSTNKTRRKKDYRKLINRISEILYQQDWMEINYGFNPDEYSAEAGRILLLLRDAESLDAIEDILDEVFSYPGTDLARKKRDLSKTAEAIRKAWEAFEEGEKESHPPPSDPE